MKHHFLHAVDPGDNGIPSCYDALAAWATNLPRAFTQTTVAAPKAVLLAGLPGVGKSDTVRRISSLLHCPLFRIDPACDTAALSAILRMLDESGAPVVLWVDQPGSVHLSIHRWLLDKRQPTAFVVFTTDAPHGLPEGFLRPDVVQSVWSLDLPDLRQRAALWGELLDRFYQPGEPHTHDSVLLARASSLLTPVEIREVFARTVRATGGRPDEGTLLDEVLETTPMAVTHDETLAFLRHWTKTHARSAASGTCRPGL